MSLKRIISITLSAGLVLGAASVSAEPTGQMLADTCAGCHGTDGVSTGPAAPHLAGMSSVYLVDSMNQFKSGERASTIMGRIAKGYTEEQYAAMGEVFAAQDIPSADQKTDADKVAAGAKVYEDSCEKCHDEKGALADDDSGILAGQWLPYLQYSMEDFKSGAREMPKKMAKKVKKLDDAQIEATLHFFASQK
ncbi:flavocytochrome c dehydrogenase FccAB, subunit A [Solemya velum gill symbiont]|uniref:Flavocytochrome c dehydrogenase FccAB, subunit A n=1 Tax=Solemya velum gill symbiont TaxID=2340 RepID=A0A0B0H7L4_SOVGS|nr:c-type cytochrome [Solemya velum gill symbiont]KHF25110.1 flavocytochrome c dehydrogenase FccAB, subunit A [Solemya velum gill symbiont]